MSFERKCTGVRGILVLALLFSFSSLRGSVDSLKIGLYYDWQLQSVLLTATEGSWVIITDEGAEHRLTENGILYLSLSGRKVYLRGQEQFRTLTTGFSLKPAGGDGMIGIRPLIPALSRQEYRGILMVKGGATGLELILQAETESYIAGVVKAEGGYQTDPEFYKAQAVLCRTYAFRHLGKHDEEGFDLCDGVHCQAFKGMIPDDHPISLAVRQTRGEVVYDSAGGLITAAYHSNCGGQTMNGRDVWIGEMPYLRSVRDSFCIHSRNARWKREIPLDEWTAYLARQGVPVEQLDPGKDLPFEQAVRKTTYSPGGVEISLERIREDWELKSTFFDVSVQGGRVILHGRGNGHGVGMCQEGAMKMAEKGYEYRDIIRFYFSGVQVGTFPPGEQDQVPMSENNR